MPSKKTVKKLTKEMQLQMRGLRTIGLRAGFAYHENATMCFIYEDNDPEAIRAYAQAVKIDTDENDVKFARTVAFNRAMEALEEEKAKFYNLYMGTGNQSVRYIVKQTGSVGPRSTLPAPILVKTRELINKYQSTQQVSAG